MTAEALASANVDCSIDDANLKFEMEAIAARAGPIQQIHVGTIEIRPTAMSLAALSMTFNATNLMQQWIYAGGLHLQIEVSDDKVNQSVNLVIIARTDAKMEKYRGTYILRVTRDGKSNERKGRIKECVAG
ncbi:MAG TPA: hypothetical protein VGM57_05600 [Pseudolabrys sp.]|jgi:hypothetical protein